MSIVSRHGKLPLGAIDVETRWRRLEDLLTADVFGAYRYLAPSLGAIPFLEGASARDGTTLRVWAEARGVAWSSLVDVDLSFWPRISRRGRREPDVLVRLGRDPTCRDLAILVEAKLHAPQHRIDGLSQLGYYGRLFLDPGAWEGDLEDDLPGCRPVVLVTRGEDRPDAELEEARSELSEYVEAHRTEVFWLSWHHARRAAETAYLGQVDAGAPRHELALLADLIEDLEHRGFSGPRRRLPWPLDLPEALDSSVEVWLRGAPPSPGRRTIQALGPIQLPDVGEALCNWRLT